ncbi:extracellular solute-binding protein [Bradyrhizobium mercantei]|uniref:extracellular solute-binding protein n=1 Tax=Bradyrhizobium mercantei TaxID=1904807 RepID=UPI0009F982EB|nr:extracellular solute-binding protein [Bradyrhizobium mercantei]
MINRRRLLGMAAVGVPAISILRTRSASAQAKEIRVAEDGGVATKAFQSGFVEPFTKKTGVKVTLESPNPLGKLRAMVEAGQTGTVLYTGLGSVNMLAAKRLGLIDPIDWGAVDPAPMYPEAKKDYGFGHQYFSTVMAWNAVVKAPKSWADFFDAKAFPGKRALVDLPQYSLPFALLATGVPVDKLYPLDVNAAFKKLREFKSHVSVWTATTPQGPQLLRDNEVQYAVCSGSRVVGDPALGMTWDHGRLDVGYACIVKTSKPEDRVAAYKLLHEMSLPENQARYAEIFPVTGPNPDLDQYLPKDKLSTYPASKQNKAVQWLENPQWWNENGEAINKKWQEFKLGL